MKFWDTSALAPLLVEEGATAAVQRLYLADQALVWWGTLVECASAIARLERDEALTRPAAEEAFRRLDAIRAGWVEIEPGDALRDVARRMLRVHPLRAADALQLAAAFLASEGRPHSLPLVTLDDRLRAAAAREGFPVVSI